MQVGRDDMSRLADLIVMRVVIASTSILPRVTSGNSRATSAPISSRITMAWRCAFDLVTMVSSFRRRERADEGEAGDPFDAGTHHDRDVGCNFLRKAAMHASADAGILALGIFAHDHPVEVRTVHLSQG